MKNKKGSMTIYVLVFATTLIGMATSFIGAAENILVRTGAYALGDLWGTSITAEYDLELFDRYGIMAYAGDEGTVERKIQELCDYTFSEKRYASCNIFYFFEKKV